MANVNSTEEEEANDRAFGPVLAVAVVIILAAIINLDFSVLKLPCFGQFDSITAYQQRFLQAKHWLPRCGRVEYITDEDLGTDLHSVILTEGIAVKHFYLAENALAPCILVRQADTDLLLGNFHRIDKSPIIPGLSVIKDFKNGVMVFKRQ